MRAFITAAATAAFLAAPAIAAAATSGPQAYGSLGYSDTDVDGVNLGAIQGRIGARLSDHLAVEGELSTGVKGDQTNNGALHTDDKLTRQGAVYGVGLLPVAPNADLFARVGYGSSQVKSRFDEAGQTGSAKDNMDSWNYGVGGQYFFDGANGLRADYTRQDVTDGGKDANVWALGYVRKF